MANFQPKEMAGWLRRRLDGTCDDQGPCADVLCECDMELMRMAAETLEEVAGDD